jgi:hypothetical protein
MSTFAVLFLLGLYVLVGLCLACMVMPPALPARRNVLIAVLLWPWPIAAELVRMVTGRYPRWTPFL